jgi:hypothetical protein
MRVTKKKVNSPPMIMRLSLITTQTSLLITLNLLRITQEMCLLLKTTREMRNQRRMTLMFLLQMTALLISPLLIILQMTALLLTALLRIALQLTKLQQIVPLQTIPQQMKPPPTVNPLTIRTQIFHQLTTPKQTTHHRPRTTLQALQPQIPLRTRRPSLSQSKVAQQSQNPQNFRINVYVCFFKTFLIRPKLRRATMHFSELI